MQKFTFFTITFLSVALIGFESRADVVLINLPLRSIYELSFEHTLGRVFQIKPDGSVGSSFMVTSEAEQLAEGDLYTQVSGGRKIPGKGLFLFSKNANGKFASVTFTNHDVYDDQIETNEKPDAEKVVKLMKESKVRGVYSAERYSFEGEKLKSYFSYSSIDWGTVGPLVEAGLMDGAPGRTISSIVITKEVCDDYRKNDGDYDREIENAAQLGLDGACIPNRTAQECLDAEKKIDAMYVGMKLDSITDWKSIALLSSRDQMLPPINLKARNEHRKNQDWARFLRDVDKDRKSVLYLCEKFQNLW
jgi:hypothetical protein